MAAYSLGLSRSTSGQYDAYYEPRVYSPRLPLVIYMPGTGDTPLAGPRSAKPLLDALVAAGFAVVQPNVDGLLGNSTAMTRMSNALIWGRANLGVTTTAPVVIGISNGSECAMQYARQNPVSCCVCVLPVVDLTYIRDDDVAGLRALIDTAWGVTYPDPLPDHADILADQDAYVGLPFQMWVSTDDVLDNPAEDHSQQDFATYIGADYRSLGAVGHADSSWSGLDMATALAFVQAFT